MPPDLDAVSCAGALQWLDLSSNQELEYLAPLSRLTRLVWLDLSGSIIWFANATPLASLHGLQTLQINQCTGLRSLSFLA